MKYGITLLLMGLYAAPFTGQAQQAEIEQLLLNVEKLAQLKQGLQDLKKGYEIIWTGYTQIKALSERSFHLHDAFLQALLTVAPAVRGYEKVGAFLADNRRFLSSLSKARRNLGGLQECTPEEIRYLGGVLDRLLKEAGSHLEAFGQVLTDGIFRMSDSERLAALDALYQKGAERLRFLQQFSGEVQGLVAQRKRERANVQRLDKLYH